MARRLIALSLLLFPAFVMAESAPPVLTVIGHGAAQAAPDRATVLLSARARDPEAAKAQARVNKVMADATAAIRGLGIGADALATRGIVLEPLYSQPREGESREPRITGYQAGNTLEVRLDDPARLGQVIDAAVRAGINQIESVSFGLKDDRPLRRAALTDAAHDARMEAETLASAMGLRLLEVDEVNEDINGMPPPVLRTMVRAAPMNAATPVELDQVRVEAAVTVRYRVGAAAR